MNKHLSNEEKKEIQDLVNRYKQQLELALPLFKNLQHTRKEIDDFCKRHQISGVID